MGLWLNSTDQVSSSVYIIFLYKRKYASLGWDIFFFKMFLLMQAFSGIISDGPQF